MSLFTWYKELPPWGKGIVGVVVVGGTALTAWKIYAGIRTAIRKKQASQSIKDVEGERSEFENNGMQASYANSQYQAWASSLLTQFTGCDFSLPFPIPGLPDGADLSNSGKLLYSIVIKLRNNVDFLKLVEAWGVRTYDACGPFTGDVENVNLYQAVQDELQTNEIKGLNAYLNKQGITYTF